MVTFDGIGVVLNSRAALIAGISVAARAGTQAALQGVWRTVEVVVPGAPARACPGEATLAIFHGRHYSRVEVHTEQPPLLADQASASADQLRAVWGPFVAQAGTFELSGNNTITMQASVAKNPAAMKPGVGVFTYRREGDLLILRSCAAVADPITIKLTRVE